MKLSSMRPVTSAPLSSRAPRLACARPLPRTSVVIGAAAPADAGAASPSSASAGDREAAKQMLLDSIADCGRGYRAGRFVRGMVEEAQVDVEALSGPALNYDLLPGKWRLIYTTASDVLPILALEARLKPLIGPSPLQVGNIYQRFTAVEDGLGTIENIIQLSTPFVLKENKGLTFTVGAKYEIRSPHRIAIAFEEAKVDQIEISEGLEALIAPAFLPRGSLQQMLLLAIKQFNIRVPITTPSQLNRRFFAGYLLTYLDEDMLIGRAIGQGGTFIFRREEEEEEVQQGEEQ